MSVHYKFKSAISYDTITFDGLHISVRDLKKAILHQKQIGKNTDFDLQVTNAQTNEEYTDDQTLIPKNTSLIVSRIPLTTQQKKAWERAEQNNQLVLSKQILNLDSHEPDSAKLKGADLLGSNASEEDKINAMMAQSTQEYDPSNFVKIRGGNQYGEVPLNYVCHRCHNPGHWIKNCPNNNTTADPIDIKKATGIPRGFLVPVDGPSVPGAMLTGLGTFAVPSIDQEAYKQSMKPQKKQETKVEKVIIPEDLLCTLCSDLLTDAIMMPCCGTSFCDECIRNALLESEENECPDCHGKEISPETLIPNRYLRNAVNGFKDKTGYSKPEAVKEKVTPSKEQAPVPKIDIIQPPKEEVIIPASTQSPPSDPSIEVSRDEIYQKIAAVGDPIDKTLRNYSAIGTINNNSHNHSTFKTSQSQNQSQVPPVSVNNNNRPNNTNVFLPVNAFQNTRHTVTKSTENRVQHIARYNSQSLSIPPHHHMRPCLPIGPADISVPPPPFAHPPPSIQSDVGYNQMQPIHNPPPPGLDRNNSPAHASSDEGMHPPESNHHQMDKFDNQTGPQAMMRTGYPTGYYPPPPMPNYDPYNIPVDMRNRSYHRGYSRRPTRGQPMSSSYRPDYRNGGNYINNKRTIDDPLAVFQRILRERDSKRRDMRGRHSVSRSRSRSLSPSRSRSRSRTPSRIMNHRVRSITRSPLLRNRSITPRRRSRTRSRSPVRKRKKSLSPLKRLPVKSRRRTRSPSRDVQGRRSRSLSLHRRSRSRSRSLTHRNRKSPSPRFRSRSPSFYSSPARFNNYHREDDNLGPNGGNWRGRGAWSKGTSQSYQQSHRFRGQFEGHYELGVGRSTDYANNFAQFDPHYAMDPNLVRDWDEIRDKEIREREKEKKEEEDKQKKISKSQSPVKHHKLEKQRQEHKLSPEKNHKDADKKDKGKRKKKKDIDLDKKKKKKSREKKEKDDGKKGDEKENKTNEGEIKLEIEGANQSNQEPAAPGTSESPPPFESVVVKEEVKIKNAQHVSDGLYGDLDEVAPVDTSWGSFKVTEQTETHMKPKEETAGETIEEKPKEPEVLAELPERSKWEVEEDTSTTDDKSDMDKQKEESVVENPELQNENSQVSVTNEVLKRAENAIFQKTVRTLDTAGKKTVVDKSESIKDKKLDTVKDKKLESEKHSSKDKKPDNVKEKKTDVTKEKKIEYVKEKKIDVNRDKKVDNIKDKKQDIIKDTKSDSKNKKNDVDKEKRPDVKEKKQETVKDRRTDRDRRSNDKSSEIKSGAEKSSRRDDYASKHKDKKNVESDAAADSSSIQREARKLGYSIQITIPSDLLDDKKSNKDGAKRISAKDRLGEKVEDRDDKHYKSRNEKRKSSRSRSPVRVHSTLIVPEPPPRKVRASSKTRRDSLKKDRIAKTERTTSSNRPSRRDDEKKLDQQKKTEPRRVVRSDDKHHRTVDHKSVTKKEDRSEKTEVKKKEEKREEVVKKLKPKEKETEKKERKNRRLEPDRKVSDENFDNNDDEEIKKLPKDKESDDSVSSSSSSSSSTDSSPVRSKKRKKTKKRKKKHVKKKKLASSSDSDDSDSSSESDDANSSKHKKKKKKEQRKHKLHKKPLKKKKKTKHR
ncbi:E3 ubiquitin-protein ligase RBBP6 isoform X1 [Aphis gossypii]|uniref:E3 ubiquitin-protein ligase RBBP6 isoform X1 n=1 Tax=Aphis gossypii TaxID=80765 RepID=UPI002158A971|nr:E3 ubiquitin-protein ligase RBBP6 isoform X1 [Aphis gossypii]